MKSYYLMSCESLWWSFSIIQFIIWKRAPLFGFSWKKKSHTCLEPHKGVQMVMNYFCKDNQCNFMNTHCLSSSNVEATNCDWATGVPVPALSCWCTESLKLAGIMEHVGVCVSVYMSWFLRTGVRTAFIHSARSTSPDPFMKTRLHHPPTINWQAYGEPTAYPPLKSHKTNRNHTKTQKEFPSDLQHTLTDGEGRRPTTPKITFAHVRRSTVSRMSFYAE